MPNINDYVLNPVDVLEPNYSEEESLLRENYLQRKATHLANLVNTKAGTAKATIPSGTILNLQNASLNIVTGTTQINAIGMSNLTQLATVGYEATLLFTAGATVKHNVNGGIGSNSVLLASSTDLVAANNTVLKIIFDGNFWQEVSRKQA